MSHEELAGDPNRNAKRRKVEFKTVLEDLEGRLLLSAARQFRPRQAMALVRQMPQGNAARLRAQFQPRAGQEGGAMAGRNPFANRQAAMNAMRMRQPGFRVNISPTINVSPTINIGGPTANANPVVNVPVTPAPQATPTPTTPNAPAGQTAPTTPTTPTPTTPAPTTPTNPTRPTTPSRPTPTKPTTPGGPWTDVTKPGGQTPKPTTPTPTTPTPTNPTPTNPTPTNPTPTTPTPTNPTPTEPTTPTTPTPTTPTEPSKPAPTFPDGTILRNEQTGELGYYSKAQGARRLISPPVAEKMGIKAEQTKALTVEDFKAVPKGTDYFPDGMFVRNESTGEISRFSDEKFHVVSTPILNLLGIGVEDVATISAAQYGGVPKGNDYFPEGILIQNQQTGEVDLYKGGERHWISVPVATRMNIQPSQLVVISPTQFNAVPQGKDYFPDGVYLQNQETGEIARYADGKRGVVSAPVASKLGLTSTDLIAVSAGQYNAVTKGADYFLEGMFVMNNQSGEVSNYSGGQRHWVSPPVAAQINLTEAMITTIGADQYNAIPKGGDFTPPPPTALDPTLTAQA